MNNVLLPNRIALFIALALIFLVSQPVLALEVPPLKGRVNDYAGLLAPATVSQLEELLQNFEAAESTQIMLLTVPSLEDESLEDFSLRVVETWRPGQHKLDNGALLLISKNDRKIRIEVGYGLEGRLTDLVSGRIIREIITPRFKAGNFDQGVIDGIVAMMAAVQGEFPAATSNRQQDRNIDPGAIIIFLLIIFSVLGRILSRVPWLAAGSGAIIAPVVGTLALGLGSLWLILAVLGFIGGGLGGGFSGGSGGFRGGGGSFGGGGASGGW